jgi:hypothetical protein
MITVHMVARLHEVTGRNEQGGLELTIIGETPSGEIAHCVVTFPTAVEYSAFATMLEEHP